MIENILGKFDQNIERLKKQQEFGFRCFAFLNGIIGNEIRQEKFQNSYAGHAVDLTIRSVQSSLMMFCSRHWDKNPDAQSIYCTAALGEKALQKIIDRHQAYFEKNKIDRDADEYRDYFCRLKRDIDACAASHEAQYVRVIRSEDLAHLVVGSRDRKRALEEHPQFDLDQLSSTSLLSFARQTLELSERLVYFAERHSPGFDYHINFLTKYFDRYWDNLPNFSQVEEPF